MLKTFPGDDNDAKLKSDSLKAKIQEECLKLATENKLNSLEKPKQFHLLVEPFSIENELLTPTMKLKRNVAKKQYEEVIGQMYAAGMFKAPGQPAKQAPAEQKK